MAADPVVISRLFTIFPVLVLLSQLLSADPISSEDLQFFENKINACVSYLEENKPSSQHTTDTTHQCFFFPYVGIIF